jgi:hypothetical protein
MMYVLTMPSVEADVQKEEKKQLFHIGKKYGDAGANIYFTLA